MKHINTSPLKIVDNTFVLVICGLISLVSIAYCIWSGNQINWPDESEYIGIAKRLVAGLGFTNGKLELSALRPPGYPFYLSLIYHIHASVLLAKITNVVALTATAWIISLIVKSITPLGQVFAPLLVLAYPLFIYLTGMLVPQILGSFLFVLVVYWLIQYPKSILYAALTGATLGALILTIPTFALIFICLIVLLFIINSTTGFYSKKFILFFFVATVLVVGPWIVRSSLLFDKFVFISTNSGINLLYGNSEHTEYDTGVVDVSKYSNITGMNEAEVDSYYKKAAIDWVKNNPGDAAILYLKKVANNFNYKNKLGTVSESSTLKNTILFITYYPLLVTALIRCLLWRKYAFSWPEVLMYALYFGSAFISAIVYTRIRYRIPFDFLLIAMVSIFIGYIRQNKLKVNQ